MLFDTIKKMHGEAGKINLHFDRLLLIENQDEWKEAYIEEINKLDQLYQEELLLYYELYAYGTQNQRMEEIQRIKHNLMTNERLITTIAAWKERLIDDSVWHRRLDVFLSKMNEEALDSHPEIVKIQQELQVKLMESNFQINGITYNLGTVHSNVMENSDRELRRKLFQEAKKIGEENEGLFRTLIQKRNELAVDFGFSSYYQFKCSLKEINIDTYFVQMKKLLANTVDSSNYWDQRIKEKFGWNNIHHYDQYYSTFHFHKIENPTFEANRMKEVLSDVASSIGVQLQQIPVSIESIEIPYGGFCINIRPDDIKLVVNKRDSYSAFLSGIHEFGHAIDGHFGLDQFPELYRFYSSIAAESIAELFQTIITDVDFLRENFELGDVYTQIDEVNQLMNIKMVKINHYYSLVEYELYNNPKRSFQEIADECYHYVFGAEGEAFHPASEMFYIENPAFFQDYNFALAIRDMIRNTFKINSLYGQTEVFQAIRRDIIEPNQLYSWKERVERLCGKPHTFADLESTLLKLSQD